MSHTGTVLVTGASGFVGQATLPVLAGAGWRVRAAARHRARRSLAAGVDWVEVGDITDAPDWPSLLEGVDAVVHLAGRAHMLNDGAADPLAAYRQANVYASEQLALSAAQAGVRRLVFVSSVKAAGESSSGSALCEEDPVRPEDPYGISKREAELRLLQIGTDSGLEIVILRPPLVYGPGVRANFLRLMRWVDRGIPLPFGAVGNRRSMIYVGNLADALRACVASPGAAGETFFVSDGEDLSTPELIRRLAKALDRPARLISVPSAWLKGALAMLGKGAEAERLLGSLTVSIARIHQKIGWVPPIGVTDGLTETARAYRAKLSTGVR